MSPAPDDPDQPDDETLPTDQVTVDVASPEGLKQQRRTAKQVRQNGEDFWHQVFASEIGRREMWQIIHTDMHAFNPNFAVGPVGFPDPNAAWYERGIQDKGLILYHRWLALEPEGVRKMHEENDPRFGKQKRPRRATPN